MMAAKILISIATVFIALSLACAMRFGRRRDTPAKPSFGYTRSDLDALTRRADARAAADPLGLRRPLFFRALEQAEGTEAVANSARKTVRVPSGTAAGGGDPLHTGFPAVRYFRLIRSDRQEAGNV